MKKRNKLVKFQLTLSLIYRTSIDCSAKCVANKGCSAFHFDEDNRNCELGSSLKLPSSGGSPGPSLLINALKIGKHWLYGYRLAQA